MASRIVQYPLGPGGPNQKIAQELIDPNASLLDVQNGVFDHDGSIEKRLGSSPLAKTALGNSPAMGAPVKLLSRGSELLATDGDSLGSYSPDGSIPGWTEQSLMIPCQATRTPGLTLPVGAGAGFCFAEGGGRRVWWYHDASGLPYYGVQSLTTGAWVVAPALFSAGATVMTPVILYDATSNLFYGFFVTFVAGGASHNQIIYGWTITPSGVLSSSSPVVSDCYQSASTYPRYDVCTEVGGGTGLLVVYGQTDADGASSSPRYLRLEALPALTVTASAVLESYQGQAEVVASCCCRYDGTLGVVWFFWQIYNSGSTNYVPRAMALTAAWATIGGPSSITSFPGYVTSNNGAAILAVEPLTSALTASTTLALFVVAAPATPGAPTVSLMTQGVFAANGSQPGANAGFAEYPNCTLVSRPFRVTVGAVTRCYVGVQLAQANVATFPQPQFCSTYVMDTMCMPSTVAAVRPRVVATLAPRQSSYQAYANQLIDCRAANPTDIGAPAQTTVRLPIAVDASVEFSQANSLGGSFRGAYGAWVAQLDYTGSTSWQYAEGNAETFVSGGVPSSYGGEQLAELSFFSWPVALSFAQIPTGSLTTAGVYAYAFCWAQVDEQGQIHRSSFWSQIVTLTGSNTGILWSVQDLPFSARYNRTSPPVLEVYRSTASGTVLYFEGLVTSSASLTSYATPLAFQSGVSDTSLVVQSLQYTTGGVLDSVCPPSLRGIIRHVDRLWGIDDTGLNIWYTTTFNAAVAPYFNESLTLSFTEEPLTALSGMDDKLVAFSQDEIWYVEGYGPAPTGLGSDLTVAVKVPTDTGAADWRSVVGVPTVGQFPGGVFFQSSRNGLIYLLDRGLTVTCVGKVVQDWFGASPGIAQAVVLSANTVALTTQIRFVLSTGFVATYDYVQQAWSRQGYPVTLLHSVAPNEGPWSWCGADGYVYQELSPSSSAPYYDTIGGGGATWITTVVATATVRPSGGLQSAMQLDYVQGVARFFDACDIQVHAFYDYGATTETWTFTNADMLAQGGNLALWRASPLAANSQPMAVSVILSDAPPTGGTATTGQGVRWLGLAYSLSTIGDVYDKLGLSVRQ